MTNVIPHENPGIQDVGHGYLASQQKDADCRTLVCT